MEHREEEGLRRVKVKPLDARARDTLLGLSSLSPDRLHWSLGKIMRDKSYKLPYKL